MGVQLGQTFTIAKLAPVGFCCILCQPSFHFLHIPSPCPTWRIRRFQIFQFSLNWPKVTPIDLNVSVQHPTSIWFAFNFVFPESCKTEFHHLDQLFPRQPILSSINISRLIWFEVCHTNGGQKIPNRSLSLVLAEFLHFQFFSCFVLVVLPPKWLLTLPLLVGLLGCIFCNFQEWRYANHQEKTCQWILLIIWVLGLAIFFFPSTIASQYVAHVFGMCHNLQCPLALGQEPDWLAREWVWYSGSSRGWMSFTDTAGWMFSPDLATESSRTRVLALATSFSSTNKKGTGTLKGFGRRVQVVDQDKALVPRSGPLHFGKGSRSLGCAKFTFCCGFQWAWTGGGAADDAPTWGSWSRGWKRRSALSHSRGWKRRSALAKRRFSSGFRRGNWMELVCGFKEEQTFQISNLSKQSFKENNVKSLNAKTWFQGSKTRFQIWSSKKSEQCKITRNHISLQRSLKNSKPRLLRMEDTEHDVPGNAKNIWMNTNDQSKTWHPSFFTDHRCLDTEGYPRKKFQP